MATPSWASVVVLIFSGCIMIVLTVLGFDLERAVFYTLVVGFIAAEIVKYLTRGGGQPPAPGAP